ncbi:MAG: division/cell wall cluster transcriptional repressor MraZ [Candidatus Zhuqueibacterota bacterium]
MAFFIGEFFYTLDEKGRVNIPAKFRKATSHEAQGNYIITYGKDQCVYIYPMDIYEKKMVSVIDNLSEANAEHRAYMSLMGSRASDATLDKQGRIMIPPKYLEWAGIDKNVHIIGAYNRIEVWNPDIRKEYQNKLADLGESLEEKIVQNLNK